MKPGIMKIAIYIIFLAATGTALFIPGVESSEEGMKAPEKSTKSAETFNSELPELVEFTFASCPNCKEMAPIVSKLTTEFEGKVEFIIVSIDEPDGQKIADEYGVHDFPTFMFFDRSGNEIKGMRINQKVPEEMLRRILIQVAGRQ
jgi:thioredoxin 1